MSIPIAEKLLERASSGERLNAVERRHCVAFLMGTQPDLTNNSLADMFKVSERQVRNDKKNVKKERVALLKEDDIGLVVADIVMTFDRQMRDIESSKKKCKVGSRDYLDHCKSIHAMQLATVKALQDLGYYPKNLGNMTVEKYEYSANVAVDESRPARPLDMKFELGVQDAEFEEVPQLTLPPPADAPISTE